MTDLDIYQPAAVAGYQPGMVMDEKAARALDEQVRRCTQAVLREGTDYGTFPARTASRPCGGPARRSCCSGSASGTPASASKSSATTTGASTASPTAHVARRLPDGTLDIKATCEGTADYDESKFYQSEEQVRARLSDQEHKWAAKDRRVPNADRWNSAKEYRADWNALMKRAQKRAIVGAVVDATAAGGIFTDREEDDSTRAAAGRRPVLVRAGP